MYAGKKELLRTSYNYGSSPYPCRQDHFKDMDPKQNSLPSTWTARRHATHTQSLFFTLSNTKRYAQTQI
jgi:hypothetical protein